jgi:hypothetical protein
VVIPLTPKLRARSTQNAPASGAIQRARSAFEQHPNPDPRNNHAHYSRNSQDRALSQCSTTGIFIRSLQLALTESCGRKAFERRIARGARNPLVKHRASARILSEIVDRFHSAHFPMELIYRKYVCRVSARIGPVPGGRRRM